MKVKFSNRGSYHLVQETLKYGNQKKHDLTKEDVLEYYQQLNIYDCNLHCKEFLSQATKDFIVSYEVSSHLLHLVFRFINLREWFGI